LFSNNGGEGQSINCNPNSSLGFLDQGFQQTNPFQLIEKKKINLQEGLGEERESHQRKLMCWIACGICLKDNQQD
jgi:hypothetical protein